MKIKITKNLLDYEPTIQKMEEKVNDIVRSDAEQEIWLLEHNHVYTGGTSSNKKDLIGKGKNNVPVFETGRGGQYTYHGPGQRVGYLMLNLKEHYSPPDLKKFVYDIEESIINSLKELALQSFRRKDRVGIWLFDKNGKEAKIAAIGIRVRKWVSFHGFSVNVNPNLNYFNNIIPCGISEFGVTSLKELGVNISMAEFDDILIKNLKIGKLSLI